MKMSKSLGNVIDPMEIIEGCELEDLKEKIRQGNLPEKEVARALKLQEEEFPDGIPECGADALRFGLLAYTVQGKIWLCSRLPKPTVWHRLCPQAVM